MEPSLTLARRLYPLAEDEYLAASSTMMVLEDEGAEIAGPVSNVVCALKLVNERTFEPDGAILDLSLRGTMAYRLAETLTEYQTSFVFVTGHYCSSAPKPFMFVPCLSKPCKEKKLVAMLASLPVRQSRPGVHPAG
ncbi:response regulator [Rhizobium sp. 268]|uniref:response regulator n=1 Tax=Rhizobium sp. 268 TaxID=2996375 RepID=UPI002F95A8D7